MWCIQYMQRVVLVGNFTAQVTVSVSAKDAGIILCNNLLYNIVYRGDFMYISESIKCIYIVPALTYIYTVQRIVYKIFIIKGV